MVISKQYLKWEKGPVSGIVYTSGTNCLLVDVDLALIPACETVNLWNLRSKTVVRSFYNKDFCRVSKIAKGTTYLAVGLADGNIDIYNYESADCVTVLCGHKSEITSLKFNDRNTLLASGSKDTVVVVWDVVSQSGLYRLLGHTGSITDIIFLKNQSCLITSSKDCLIKFWDLGIQHCMHTVVGHKTEVTCIETIENESILVVGAQDPELRFYSINWPSRGTNELGASNEEIERKLSVEVEQLGSHLRSKTSSAIQLKREPKSMSCFYCLSQNSKSVECFDLRNSEEMNGVSINGKTKRRKNQSDSEIEESKDRFCFIDRVKPLRSVSFSRIVKIFDIVSNKAAELQICAGLFNNDLEYKMMGVPRYVESVQSLTACGHRTDVRTVSIASDSSLIITCSKETTKVWSKAKGTCLRTIECEFGLCSVTAPGNKHVVLGTKTGKLCVIDLGASDVSSIIDAHMGEVWGLDQYPNMRGVVSGGSDKCLKFWDYVLEPESNDKLALNLSLSRKLDLDEDVLAIKISADSKYIAVAFLDNSIKVFFFDTLKFFLNMYGHKLPVVSTDISTDGQLLVSGSADRNMKIWGMDFGDCHRSLFAHEDSITCVRFVPKTHLIFSCGKDGLVKQWDADRFLLIQILRVHYKCAAWALGISPNGDFIVSAGADKSIRMWERTMEPLIIEEEQENEREKEFSKEVEDNMERDEPFLPSETETTLASRKTMETLKGAELLMERLEIWEQSASGEPVPILKALGTTSNQYLLDALSKITSSELEQSLMMLPYSYATRLIEVCCKNFIIQGLKIETNCRIVLSLIRMHHARIVSDEELASLVFSCKTALQTQLALLKDRIAFNTFALQYLREQIERKDETKLFIDATDAFKEKSQRRRRRDKAKAIITVVS